jgi:predicted transcriptional regulator
MIKSMITKLKEEAAAEAAHNAWCAEETKKNKLKRDKKTAKVNLLTAELNELTASIETMGKTIQTLIKEQADLTKALKDATEQRNAEHAKNTKAIADAKAGAAAVGQALTVLKEFYSAQAALLQEGKQVPEMAAYKGQQAGKGGIIGMLEVIESDFLRLDSDTTTEEKENAAEYETFSADATADKEAKHKEELQTKLDKDDAEFKKSKTKKDLKAVTAELDKANKYYDNLKPQCLEVKVSYEERVAKRKQEIESLKEAYKVLDGM